MVDEDAPWKAALGAAARALREAHGLTRQQVADKAGLSLRFLAEVEAGRANPSLGSLHALAGAFGVDVVELLGRQRAPRTVALLGLRGAGKSTVGRKIGKRLQRRFVELDKEIEAEAGMSLPELFALHGEAHYRTLEHRVLLTLLAGKEPVVVATGGGVVTHEESFRLLRQRALTVWLKATPQEHWDRVLAQGDLRPMQRARARAELEELYARRAPLYAEAELIVDTTALDVDRAAERIGAAAS